MKTIGAKMRKLSEVNINLKKKFLETNEIIQFKQNFRKMQFICQSLQQKSDVFVHYRLKTLKFIIEIIEINSKNMAKAQLNWPKAVFWTKLLWISTYPKNSCELNGVFNSKKPQKCPSLPKKFLFWWYIQSNVKKFWFFTSKTKKNNVYIDCQESTSYLLSILTKLSNFPTWRRTATATRGHELFIFFVFEKKHLHFWKKGFHNPRIRMSLKLYRGLKNKR